MVILVATGGSSITLISFTANNIGLTQFRGSIAVASGLVAGNAALMNTSASTPVYIDIESEL